jgi:hypothetical protein
VVVETETRQDRSNVVETQTLSRIWLIPGIEHNAYNAMHRIKRIKYNAYKTIHGIQYKE